MYKRTGFRELNLFLITLLRVCCILYGGRGLDYQLTMTLHTVSFLAVCCAHVIIPY